ncbi:hypothetical protein [Chitinophaga sp. CF418]|uniref:hypothetical protein n=1 Tax=Chitinophaga sp. CF418 TaxID=1855287 RepID=UPI000918FB90|nr:hypothetical protein [Chitinophaga sp. CF418]SHN44490.1 hypothetical protein SAMN05216311_117101 [Chitinophaga sp. CF418]
MKKLALFLLATGIFASACKKDGQGEKGNELKPTGGEFTIEGKSYLSDYTYWTGTDGLVLTNLPQAPEYIENAVQIFVDSLYFSHTYTYMDRNNAAYDRKKHFSNAVVKYTPSGIYGNGQEITGVTGGTMNVSNNGETFTIDFNITVAGRQMQGTYVGKVAGKKF